MRVFSSLLPGDHNHHSDHHHNNDHHDGHTSKRQGRDLNNLLDFSTAVLDEETGMKCINTEESIQSLEREKLLSCTHSSINICHFTYVTKFKPFRQEICEEIYTKNCNIVFNKHAVNETIQHCYTPLVQNCDNNIEEDNDQDKVCREFYESSCVTRYNSDIDSNHAVTNCEKIPVTLCGSRSCSPELGDKTCHDKVRHNLPVSQQFRVK